MDDSPVKTEGGAARHRAGYKSWKKKYRKMRIVFDQKMHDGEELHKQEAKAAALVKRLAVENDRLLDILLEVNNSPQIPPEKQIDLSLEPSSDSTATILPLDRDRATRKNEAAKKLEDLLSNVPHSSYNHAKEALPAIVDDLKAPEGESHPADFLSADDVDNYIYEVDTGIDPETHIPTLAPNAHPNTHQPPHPNLKNPTSVTNWLRKHAPKIFLQDGESHADAEDGEGGHTGGRKTRGGRGERGGRASTRGKRGSAAARASAAADRERGDWDASMDDDADFGATPVGRGKRKRDDDGGYKPRGSSTRPTKKKRKSEVDGTPSVRKSKKEAAAAARDD
ncbi:IEC3 subunit of the Ino80 complex, chromatin re-modelling-domain-containing protein [Ilyonectria robusta]|uniref:IEC3 subunit of the Ino80 complex, chromatin re-modelling-domain-containing protein n=1 Tax=Ilyonectria robusta TaxID=1079257 RepID=UPI001E8E5949|nr:IEC3 subunit of the Ino80 complex, chromatin re-modelling-domain-containing protein [Ilyonectria robusta]KAH8672972.1 IEC3 subunit of the Ino80 complex, chromatin re-modelling-domain-containing protein [Ilyonectria robusta]